MLDIISIIICFMLICNVCVFKHFVNNIRLIIAKAEVLKKEEISFNFFYVIYFYFSKNEWMIFMAKITLARSNLFKVQ